MARLYHRLFYQLYCFFCSTAREGWEDSKALIAVNGLCALVALEGLVWGIIAVKKLSGADFTPASHPLLVVVPLAGAIVGGNYRFFLHRDGWKGYARQFRAEPVRQQRRAAWGAFAAILVLLGSLVGAFYCLSRVNGRP